MKKWVKIVLIIVAILVLIFIGMQVVENLRGSSSSIGAEESVAMIGKVTDGNSFDDIKLNPFDNDES